MRHISFLFIIATSFLLNAQQMNTNQLGEIITEVADNVEGELGRWQFHINETIFIAITDENNNRMRIISPITDVVSLDKEMFQNALVANFHSALDVKYAISEDVLWSTFIHPLKELSEEQVRDAISQVYYANVNFGTTYASTSLIFPGSQKSEQPKEKKLKTKKI